MNCKKIVTSHINIYVGLGLILFYYLLFQLYIISKYGGNYWDGDSLVMTYYTAQVLESGSIYVGNGYGSGINYQIFATILSEICKFELIALYSYVVPVVNVILIILVYYIMNKLTNDKAIALLATFLLLLQPDFLLITHRAKHDPYSLLLGFMIFTSFLMYLKSFNYQRKFAYSILLLTFIYSYSLYSLPFFTLFISGMIFYLIIDIIISRKIGLSSKSLGNFLLISIILILVLNVEIYKPFGSTYNYMGNMIESIKMIFVATSMESEAIYGSYIGYTYNSVSLFLILFAYNLLLGVTAIYSFIKCRNKINFELKLCFVAFALLTIVMLVSDHFGFASNMGLRAFYYLTIPSVAISSIWLFPHLNSKKKDAKKIFIILFIICFLVWSSYTKATADSDYINTPFNYLDAEVSILEFAEYSDVINIFADHRLKYVGAGYMSTNFWDRDKLFMTDISYYNSSIEKGFYINSIIYVERGFRGDGELVKINKDIISNLENHNKIYDNCLTKGYLI